ncbi:division/cell wall cluster transcriptional repressor MraZ [Oceaniglobus ichthyenteri]|uniref:division/cell wall cluster transcriptional repressor MraZ n=1 Tax=Oceaniglobus ichthyenteri TaxID=2136177 RepID=UPI000D3677C7|nr:division/cell wall cluster transcriptional repressor MraZ [Oceaniglobus ichthyenteri]
MFDVFIGEHENKIDSKARLSIPADFRRVLEEGDPKWEPGKNATMVIVYGDHRRNYLEVFPVTDVMKLYKLISKMPRGSKKRDALQKLYASQSVTATLDETGRIVLSAKLRQKLGLDGAAAIVGYGDTFQIWKPETYAEDAAALLREDEDFDPDLDPSVYLPGDED